MFFPKFVSLKTALTTQSICTMDFSTFKTWQRVSIFVALWATYGLYYFVVNRLDNEAITLGQVCWSVPFFALITHGVYFILDRFFARKRIAMGIVCLLGFYASLVPLAKWIVYHVAPYFDEYLDVGGKMPYSHGAFLQTTLVMLGNYSMFALVFFFMQRNVEKANALRKAAEDKLQALEAKMEAEMQKQRYEYLALAGQVSPHFMANLLNGWMVKLGHLQGQLAMAMQRAYLLMVYHMDARLHTKRVVPLIHEVEQMEAYIELVQQTGLPKHIIWQQHGSIAGNTIPPTTLLSFFENATKYGRMDLPEMPIAMQLDVNDERLSFLCTNAVKDNPLVESHGVGLANLRRRLELEYGNRCTLQTGTRNGSYVVELTINYGLMN